MEKPTLVQLKVSYWVLSVTFLSFLLITGSVSSSGSLPFIVQQCHVEWRTQHLAYTLVCKPPFQSDRLSVTFNYKQNLDVTCAATRDLARAD